MKSLRLVLPHLFKIQRVEDQRTLWSFLAPLLSQFFMHETAVMWYGAPESRRRTVLFESPSRTRLCPQWARYVKWWLAGDSRRNFADHRVCRVSDLATRSKMSESVFYRHIVRPGEYAAILTFCQSDHARAAIVLCRSAPHGDFTKEECDGLREVHSLIDTLLLQPDGSLQSPRRDALLSLTPAERKVAALIVDGLSNREIAEELRRGRATVKAHLSHIYYKLAIRNRIQLTRVLSQKALPPS